MTKKSQNSTCLRISFSLWIFHRLFHRLSPTCSVWSGKFDKPGLGAASSWQPKLSFSRHWWFGLWLHTEGLCWANFETTFFPLQSASGGKPRKRYSSSGLAALPLHSAFAVSCSFPVFCILDFKRPLCIPRLECSSWYSNHWSLLCSLKGFIWAF